MPSNSSPTVSFQVSFHSSNFWLMVAVGVAGAEDLHLVLDTGTLHSALSAQAREALEAAGVLHTTGRVLGTRPIYQLRGLSIEDQAVPDLDVVVSSRATMLRIDGMLGLNFLALFSDVHFAVDDMRVPLTRRP